MAKPQRRTREFTPSSKKSSRRTTDSGKRRGSAAPAEELEVLEDVEEKRSVQLEAVLVYMTTLGLIVGIILALSAVGSLLEAGPFKGNYEGPTASDFPEPGMGDYEIK